MFIFKADVQPFGLPFTYQLGCIAKSDRMQGWFFDHVDECILTEPHQDTVRDHSHIGVAGCLGNQRFFTEAVTGLQYRQINILVPGSGFA